MKIKDCLACKLADKEKIKKYLESQTEVSAGICECDYDCVCFMTEFGDDFIEHMDTHAEEMITVRVKLYSIQQELLKEVF